MSSPQISGYLQLYKYLAVLSEEQIIKLRRIAVGILRLSAFSPEEIAALEKRAGEVGIAGGEQFQ